MEQMALRKRTVLRLVLKKLWYAAILLYRFTFHWFGVLAVFFRLISTVHRLTMYLQEVD